MNERGLRRWRKKERLGLERDEKVDKKVEKLSGEEKSTPGTHRAWGNFCLRLEHPIMLALYCVGGQGGEGEPLR